MERNERETVDFMNVESFSQLPFIRPAAPLAREKGGACSAIRLFGKEFGGGNYDDDKQGGGEGEGSKELVSNENYYMMSSSSSSSSSSSNCTETSIRKFECHYCCRNFPTSQALGGHQNAHKRERQSAKRAHLQSAMVHGGLMSYRRLGSAAAVAHPPPFHSWNGGGGAAVRSYSGYHQPQPGAAVLVPPPINGSPLGLWRIPAAQTPSSMPFPNIHRQIPLLNEQLKPLISTSQSRFAFESKPAAMQDHVSLDLRL